MDNTNASTTSYNNKPILVPTTVGVLVTGLAASMIVNSVAKVIIAIKTKS